MLVSTYVRQAQEAEGDTELCLPLPGRNSITLMERTESIGVTVDCGALVVVLWCGSLKCASMSVVD